MGKGLKRFSFWLRRRSHFAVIAIGALVITLLYLNDDASWKSNMEYQSQIKELKEKIQSCNDSAEYYRARREQLITGTEQLEQIAREEYHMQKPTEDVYIINETNK
ncbi:MAG: septum formation initiator family protein [Lepagella sp.]